MIIGTDYLLCVEIALRKVQGLLKGFPRTPDDTVVVLDVQPDAVYYYCASWESRCIFWPEPTEIFISTGHARPVYDKALLGAPFSLFSSIDTNH